MNRTQNLSAPAADPDNTIVVTPADILRGAARYLELHGWNQHYFFAKDDNPFPAADALGAIRMAACGNKNALFADPADEGVADYFTSYLWSIGEVSHINLGRKAYVENIGYWNDHASQTAENVIAALRAAAEQWEAEAWAENELDHDRIPTTESYNAWRAAR